MRRARLPAALIARHTLNVSFRLGLDVDVGDKQPPVAATTDRLPRSQDMRRLYVFLSERLVAATDAAVREAFAAGLIPIDEGPDGMARATMPAAAPLAPPAARQDPARQTRQVPAAEAAAAAGMANRRKKRRR